MVKMWRVFGVVILCFITTRSLFAQRVDKDLDFCYWRYSDTGAARKAFGNQPAFLRLKNHDTIVDIGASSGSYDGALASFMEAKDVHFVLVDIDTNCLNARKVNNMQAFYTQVKGSPLPATFSIVNNTPDSLFLALNRYGKVFLVNTLHEIPAREKFVRSVCNIMRPGGELILSELLSRPRHTIHGGCRQPLLDEEEIKTLFEQNGFHREDVLMNPNNAKRAANPLMMARFVKN